MKQGNFSFFAPRSVSKALSSLIVLAAFFGCEDEPKKTVGMCYYYLDTPPDSGMLQGMFAFCTSPTTNDPPCNDEATMFHTYGMKYVSDSGQIGTYNDEATCEEDLDAVLDKYSDTGSFSPGPSSNEMGGSSSGSTGGGTPAGCSTTEAALKAKCERTPEDVYDSCTLNCNAVCVNVDGCNCGIEQYCTAAEVECKSLAATGCNCPDC